MLKSQTKWKIGNFDVIIPEGYQLLEAKTFANKAYLRGGSTATKVETYPAYFFSFYEHTRLIGTAGFYLCNPGEELPTETGYDFQVLQLIDHEMSIYKVGEVGRLSSDGKDRFKLIISFMGAFMYELGLKYAMFSVKPKIERALRIVVGLETAIHDHLKPGAKEKFPNWIHPYMFTDPTPIVVTVDLEKNYQVFKKNLDAIKEV